MDEKTETRRLKLFYWNREAEQIAADNAGWPVQFRFAVHADWSRVPELWTLIWLQMSSER